MKFLIIVGNHKKMSGTTIQMITEARNTRPKHA